MSRVSRRRRSWRVGRAGHGYRPLVAVNPGVDPRPTVLALRALAIGDLLVAVPAVRALRRAYPEHRLVLATTPALAPLVDRIGAVDTVAPTPDPTAVPWSGCGPDVAVNLHGTGPQSHRALDALNPGLRIGFRCPAAGWDGPDWNAVAAAHPHERARWCALLQDAGVAADPGDLRLRPPAARPGPRPVLVHPGAAFGAKRWPVDRFAAVATALDGPGAPVLVTGSAAERDLAHAVTRRAGLPAERNLAGRTDLAALCDLVAGAALVVSGDTGIAHLASAYGTPSVVLFGPVDPAQWGPPADGPHVALAHPAGRRGARFADEPDPALLAITVDEVLAAAAGLPT
jgi:ADP-heptose:LPS heptosyltransferase